MAAPKLVLSRLGLFGFVLGSFGFVWVRFWMAQNSENCYKFFLDNGLV